MNTISSEHERIINRMLRPHETKEVITITKSDITQTVADLALYKAGKAGFMIDAAIAAKVAAIGAIENDPGRVKRALHIGALVAHVSDPATLRPGSKHRRERMVEQFLADLALAHYQAQLAQMDEIKRLRAERHGNGNIVRISRNKRQIVGATQADAPPITIPSNPQPAA